MVLFTRSACCLSLAIVATVFTGEAVAQNRYEEVDSYALNAPESATRSIANLSRYLTAPFTQDHEKARAIFCWIAHNISYDVEGFFSGSTSSSDTRDVLQSRSSVCAGYSSLFGELGRAAGLDVETVNGYAKGFSYQPGDPIGGTSNHAWNAVRLGGTWKLIDCTWGAGSVDNAHAFIKNYEPYFFCTNPEEFVYRHLPDNPRWQLLQRPVSRNEFQNLPFVFPAFFQLGIVAQERYGAVLNIQGESTLRFSMPQDVRCMADLETGGRKMEGTVFPQRSGTITAIRVLPPSAGTFLLNL
jgi:transglutaminase/protease-like cytokinesis protein 3